MDDLCENYCVGEIPHIFSMRMCVKNVINCFMMVFRSRSFPYSICLQNQNISTAPYPYLRCDDGDIKMHCISPIHGRSYIIGRSTDGRYIVSKGNGLNYSEYVFLNTGEMGNDTWGLLLRQDAVRDFLLGQEVATLGIKTNQMEYVLELDIYLSLPNGNKIKPCLLQYSLECPYRITDVPFMSTREIKRETDKWETMNEKRYKERYLIAADILVKNLYILHSHNILHNAIQESNYTWALELLDFELSCSPSYPYEREDYQRHVVDLFSRRNNAYLLYYQLYCRCFERTY